MHSPLTDPQIEGLRLCLQTLEEEAQALKLMEVAVYLRAAHETLTLSD